MNGRILHDRFPEVYEELYSKCDVVCSAPTCFFWSGDNVVRYGVPAVVQKLPLRIYVGFQRSSRSEVDYGSFIMYCPKSDAFLNYDLTDPGTMRIAVWLDKLMRQSRPNMGCGLKIHVLSETVFGAGRPYAATSSGALAAALAACAAIKLWGIEARDLERACQHRSGPAFETLLRFAWKANLVYAGGDPAGNGADIFSALTSSPYPQMFVAAPFLGAQGLFQEVRAVTDVTGYNETDEVCYRGFDIADFATSPQLWSWPFDFGLLYSGLPKRSRDALHYESSCKRSFEEVAEWWDDSLAPRLSSKEKSRLVLLDTIARGSDNLWQAYLRPAVIISLRTFLSLVNLFTRGFSLEEMGYLTQHMNSSQVYLQSLGLSDSWIDYLCNLLIYEIFRSHGVKIGVKLSGAGMGGGLAFAAASGTLRDGLPSFLEKLGAEGVYDLRLEYASWADGYEEEGLRIEQHVEEDIFSASRSKYPRVTIWDGIDRPHDELLLDGGIAELIRRYDIVASMKEKCIYIAGQRMRTMHGLHSAKYTVQLLSLLLAEPSLELAAEKMPEESQTYSSNRCELQGKIVGPLLRLVRDRTGKELALKVRSEHKRLSLELSSCDVSICVVR